MKFENIYKWAALVSDKSILNGYWIPFIPSRDESPLVYNNLLYGLREGGRREEGAERREQGSREDGAGGAEMREQREQGEQGGRHSPLNIRPQTLHG